MPVEALPQERALAFLLLIPTRDMDPEELTHRALLVTAAYKAYCVTRRGCLFSSREVLDRALEQGLKEAALGHQKAQRCLDGRWLRRPGASQPST